MYTLYHIPKRKEWGCTKNLKRRVKSIGYELSDVVETIEILDKNIAADTEKELNIRDGYGWSERHDYRVVTKMNKPFTKEQQSKGGRIQSSKHITCPHCGKSGKGMIMGRWHMDNCKSS
jgi:hypothetical protein